MAAILSPHQVLNRLSPNFYSVYHWQKFGIDSGSGLAPNGRQAIP